MAVDRRLTKVRVALLADALEPDPDGVCAVVDVIRASTTLAESGDPEVWLAASPDAARAAVPRFNERPMLVGEEGGVAPVWG